MELIYDYKKLWAYVLVQAIKDMSKKNHRKKTLRWFKSKNDRINSFIGICGTLGFDPDKTRNKILYGESNERS